MRMSTGRSSSTTCCRIRTSSQRRRWTTVVSLPESESALAETAISRPLGRSGSRRIASSRISFFRAADSHTARAWSGGRHSATRASTFSIGSANVPGGRGTTGLDQCTTDRLASSTGTREFARAATWCTGACGTHSPSRVAWVTQLMTTPARAAATSIGSAPGVATHRWRGRWRSRRRTAPSTSYLLNPRAMSCPRAALRMPCAHSGCSQSAGLAGRRTSNVVSPGVLVTPIVP